VRVVVVKCSRLHSPFPRTHTQVMVHVSAHRRSHSPHGSRAAAAADARGDDVVSKEEFIATGREFATGDEPDVLAEYCAKLTRHLKDAFASYK
jgi:hypothetical protein